MTNTDKSLATFGMADHRAQEVPTIFYGCKVLIIDLMDVSFLPILWM